MDYYILPVTGDPWQVFYLPASPDGHAFEARVELRYFPLPDKWILSISDTITGQVYVNHIPVICSYGKVNDLLWPFRHLFRGNGIGSLFCLKAVEKPSTQDPSEKNWDEFMILFGDRWPAPGGG